MTSEELFTNGLYDKTGMMCDQSFVEAVWGDLLDVFSEDDLINTCWEVDVNYDGTFSVSMEDNDVYGEKYCVIKVYPIVSGTNATLDDCVCGEAKISHKDWINILKKLEIGND